MILPYYARDVYKRQANMVAEAYRSGAMKNIIGRGIAKKQYYLSIVFTVSAAYMLVMLIGGVIAGVLAGNRFGMGAISYPGYYALSVIARILFAMAHISFALTMTAVSYTHLDVYKRPNSRRKSSR